MATRPSRKPLANSVKFWNIMLFADPGSGKTVFAGQDNKVLFMAPESDDSLLSAQTMGSTAEFIEDIKRWEDVKNTYEWYSEHPGELENVNVFVIDSMSEMQHLAKDYVLRMTAEEKARKNQDHTKMQLQDYGIMHELVENMVRGFNDLPVNVLWTATAKKVEDADKISFIAPDMQGKNGYGVAMKMAALMTAYGYLRVEMHEVPAPTDADDKAIKIVKRRVIYWEDTGTIRGKDRTNALKPFTTNLTMQQMRLAIAGKMKRAKDGKMIKVDAVDNSVPTEIVKPKPPEPEPEAAKEDSETSNFKPPLADVNGSTHPTTPEQAQEVLAKSEIAKEEKVENVTDAPLMDAVQA